MSGTVSVCSAFDGGNIEFVQFCSGDAAELQVKIRDDPFTEFEQKQHKQWFYFRASGFRQFDASTERQFKFAIVNAGQCSYSKGWEGYNTCASYDRKTWFRVPTQYDSEKGHLQWTMAVASNQIYFAYFPPYSHERHLDLIARCSAAASNPGASLRNHTDVSVRSLGNSLDGRSMDLVTIGAFIFLWRQVW
jgi:murein tripeptide amidase MpaA